MTLAISERYSFDKDILSSINGAEKLVSIYGNWPSFDSAEILNLKMERGNILECIRANNWDNQIDVSMEVNFYLFDANYADNDPRRNPRTVTILFNGIDDISLNGFNYQNPICGLGIHHEISLRLQKKLFRVCWGGSALNHDVSLLCEDIFIKDVGYINL